jgi:hypothetical protein
MIPNLMALDMELAAPAVLGPRFLATSRAAGPGCICSAPVRAGKLRYLYADRCSVDEARRWARENAAYDGVVTWNGLGFDVPVIGHWWFHRHTDRWLPAGGVHVDLYAICALLDAGVPASELERIGVDAEWGHVWPYDIWRRNRGWRLGQVGLATLGIDKHGMGGAEAPLAWQRGELDAVRRYCGWDVAITRGLYIHAWEGGELVSGAGRTVTIPRSLLGG